MNIAIPEFWMVWHEGGSPPSFKHETLASAKLEAERLARQCPGKSFCVLQCVGTCIKSDIQWLDARPLDLCEIPF